MIMLTWLVVDVALKGTIVFAAGGASALALRRASAAARHLAWTLAAIAALGLPAASALLPSWDVPLPARRPPAASSGGRPSPRELPGSLARSDGVMPPPAAYVPPPRRAAGPAVEAEIRVTPAGAGPRPWRPAAWTWVPRVWLAGALSSLLPAAVGLLSLWRLGRASRLLTAGPERLALDRLAARLGLRRPIRLLANPRRTMPMTWGVWRPLVLLPRGVESWTEERLEMVLLHELAHIQRGDVATQWLGRLACALHWFNPLAWLAAARLRVEQERACDDQVLIRGLDPPDYATHLLDLVAQAASASRDPGLSGALAMASASDIERRLRSILDPSRDRRPPSGRRAFLATLTVACLVMPLATGRLGSAGAGQVAQAEAKATAPPQELDQAGVLEQLRRLYVRPLDEAQLREGAVRGMVDALHDPYSTYLGPAELAEVETQVRGTLTGIGARLSLQEGRVTIDGTLPDSPARKAGIQPGDTILEVDGDPWVGLGVREAARRIVGPAGTKVRLSIKRRDGSDAVCVLTRSALTLRTVEALHDDAEPREWFLDPGLKVGYSRVRQFGAATAEELKEAIRAMQAAGMTGMILDLRGCPGGLLEAAVAAAGLFLPGGTVVTIRGRDGAETVVQADPAKTLGDFPLVVLVDEQTASAGEILAGALQDRGRAAVVGMRTRGKGSVQSLIKLKDGGAIRLTTSYYTLPGGRNIDRTPGKPDWGVDPDEGQFVPKGGDTDAAAPDDLPLAAARKALVGRLTTGEFARAGMSRAALATLVRRREDIETRRAALLKDLEKVDRELRELNQESAKPARSGEKK
jgi:carboxyl-terminal processing protease